MLDNNVRHECIINAGSSRGTQQVTERIGAVQRSGADELNFRGFGCRDWSISTLNILRSDATTVRHHVDDDVVI